MMIPSVEKAKEYRLRVIRLRHLYKDFLKTKVTEIVNKYLVDPIIEEMRAKGVSRKIWENVEVGAIVPTNDGIYVRIHNEYFSEDGFDVAVAREEGTEDHWVQPLRDVQQFTRLDPNVVSNLPKALSWIQDGRRGFSKGHMVSGLPRLNIIATMIESKEYELQEKINEAYKTWKRQIFN